MNLLDKYRPTCLSDIVGQPPVRLLRQFVEAPYPACFLLEGPGGVGKSATAQAFAWEMGVRPFPEHASSGLHVVAGNQVNVAWVEEFFFGAASPLRFYPESEPVAGRRWHVILIEEFDWVSDAAQRALKTALDADSDRSPLKHRSVVVVATSNGAGKLDGPLLQRFEPFILAFSGGPTFAQACCERLGEIWEIEAGGEPLPSNLEAWGMVPDRDRPGQNMFSMRVALRRLDGYLRAVKSQSRKEVAA